MISMLNRSALRVTVCLAFLLAHVPGDLLALEGPARNEPRELHHPFTSEALAVRSCVTPQPLTADSTAAMYARTERSLRMPGVSYPDPVSVHQQPVDQQHLSYINRYNKTWEQLQPYLAERIRIAKQEGRHSLAIYSLAGSTGEELVRALYEMMLALSQAGEKIEEWDLRSEGI